MSTLGLALGGGSVRGAAHIGVIRVLQEASVEPDVIVGSSSGALVGGLTALGVCWDDLLINLLRLPWNQLFRFRLRGLGPIDDSGLVEWFHNQFGDPQIEELPTRFAATAVDLNSGELVVIRRGSLLQALRASIALPGLFSPVPIGGRLLVDGGIVSTVPVDPTRWLGADRVIAVDVTHAPGPWKTTRSGILRRARWCVMNHLVETQLQHADLTIRPDVRTVASFNFERFPYCVAAGQTELRRRLPEVLELLGGSGASDRETQFEAVVVD